MKNKENTVKTEKDYTFNYTAGTNTWEDHGGSFKTLKEAIANAKSQDDNMKDAMQIDFWLNIYDENGDLDTSELVRVIKVPYRPKKNR